MSDTNEIFKCPVARCIICGGKVGQCPHTAKPTPGAVNGMFHVEPATPPAGQQNANTNQFVTIGGGASPAPPVIGADNQLLVSGGAGNASWDPIRVNLDPSLYDIRNRVMSIIMETGDADTADRLMDLYNSAPYAPPQPERIFFRGIRPLTEPSKEKAYGETHIRVCMRDLPGSASRFYKKTDRITMNVEDWLESDRKEQSALEMKSLAKNPPEVLLPSIQAGTNISLSPKGQRPDYDLDAQHPAQFLL